LGISPSPRQLLQQRPVQANPAFKIREREDPPTFADYEALRGKVNELILALRR